LHTSIHQYKDAYPRIQKFPQKKVREQSNNSQYAFSSSPCNIVFSIFLWPSGMIGSRRLSNTPYLSSLLLLFPSIVYPHTRKALAPGTRQCLPSAPSLLRQVLLDQLSLQTLSTPQRPLRNPSTPLSQTLPTLLSPPLPLALQPVLPPQQLP
jgi:hypothetical protein